MIHWIQFCVPTIRFLVLVIGPPIGFFHSSDGLRQGDPYPIYLFVLVMDALSILLRRAEEAGFILVSMIGGGGGEGVEISHLLVWNLAHIN